MTKLIRFLQPYQAAVTLILGLTLLQALSELYLPTLMADIVDKGIFTGDTDYIWRIGGVMLLVAAAGTAVSIASSYLSARIASGFGRDLRATVFRRAQSFSLREFDKIGTATLITRTTNDITQLQQVMVMILRMLLLAPMMAIGGIVMAVSKDATLSWVIVVVVPVLGLLIGVLGLKAVPMFKSMQKKIDQLNLVVREGLTGIRVVRAFNRTAHERGRFVEANRELTDTAIRVNILMAAAMPLLMIIMNFTTIAIIWFGGIRIDQGQMQIGNLMAFVQYVMQIMFAFIMVSMMFIMIPRASASAERVNEVLEVVPEIQDPDQPLAADETRGHLAFEDVVFSYPGAERPAIAGLSFTARPGEVTAIIGGTGSGKSTLVNLIPRFYDVDRGSIKLNGVDVRTMSLESLREKIGFVAQKALLFSGTIDENIRYGKAEASEEEVKQAAAIAQASEFIESMADGYDAVIAQGGTNLSGGQKQRLTIARALVRRPEVYIFDDNFSALDFKTDARLRAALRQETVAATVLIVAQRVSTVMDADQIIVMDGGHAVGIGTHKALLKSCEVYREIVASQLSEEELA